MKIKKIIVSIFVALAVFGYAAASHAQNVCGTADLGGVQLGFGNSNCLNAMNGGWGGFTNSYGLPEGSILGIVQNLLFWLLAIFSIVGIIGFLISGLLYLTAAGDSTQSEKAKKAMMYSIYGIIIGLSGFIIMKAVAAMLSQSRQF